MTTLPTERTADDLLAELAQIFELGDKWDPAHVVNTVRALRDSAWALSTWAGSLDWTSSVHDDTWLKGLRERIESVQRLYPSPGPGIAVEPQNRPKPPSVAEEREITWDLIGLTCMVWQDADEFEPFAEPAPSAVARLTRAAMGRWTFEQLQRVQQWASAMHLAASDNDGVIIPAAPDCIRPYLRYGP